MSLCNYRGGAVRGTRRLTHIRGPCAVIRLVHRCDGLLNDMHMALPLIDLSTTGIHRGKAVRLQSIINQLYWSRTEDWLKDYRGFKNGEPVWKWHHLLCFWLLLQLPFILSLALIRPQPGSTSVWHQRLRAQWPDSLFNVWLKEIVRKQKDVIWRGRAGYVQTNKSPSFCPNGCRARSLSSSCVI